nr:putative reverse transcriptase domain-containing protein [Tanacetum cinerariifolium]
MSRDVLTVGSTMRIPLLYQGDYSQWVERFMNYLEEQTDGKAMINSIKNGDQPLPRVTQVSIAGTTSTEQPPLKDKSATRLQKIYGMLLSKEKVVVSSDSEGSEANDFSELKKINALLEKAFNRRKFYSKPTTNNLRTSSTSQSANKKQEFVKSDDKQVVKKADKKKRDKDKDKQVLLAEDQAWMELRSDSDQEINANMVFMAQIKKVLSDFEASSSSADEKISEVSYYLSESECESEFETSEYYDNSTNYGLNNVDDQEIFHDAIDFASENYIENHIDSQKDYDKSDVDHNDSKEKDQLVDKLELPQQLSRVRSTFYVSKLKKCLSDDPLEIPLDKIHIDNKLHFVEETVEIIDREVKRLKQRCIPIIKVRWNSKKGPEFT